MDNSIQDFEGAKIAYQGFPGSYTHQHLIRNFKNAELLSKNTFEGAIELVQSGEADYAFIPMENSIAGRVADVHRLLWQSKLHILSEHYHAVNHCLLAKEGAKFENIKRAYSHPMPLLQCRKFLHLHNIEALPFTDTGYSAEYVSQQDSLKVAAIAPRDAIDLYPGLIILQSDIQDITQNVTRFFLLAAEPLGFIGKDSSQTTAIFFTVKNIPAMLSIAISGLAENKINITKLESFVPLLSDSVAHFYIEIKTSPNNQGVAKSLEVLTAHAESVSYLGTFAQITY